MVHFFLNRLARRVGLRPSFLVTLATQHTVEASRHPAFEQECVLFFQEIVQLFGVPKSVGQIYGLLYASPEPLGFSEIMARLEISKGSVSQGIQLLRLLGAIIEAEPALSASPASTSHLNGSDVPAQTRGPRVAYEPELSLRQLVTGVLRERIAPMAAPGSARLKRLKQLAAESPANETFYLGRTKQLESWRKRFNTVLPLITALLGPKKKTKKT